MILEKPQPLYNKKGQVNNPEIARKMAEEEKLLHNNPNEILDFHKKETNQKSIDSQTADLGRMEQIRKNDNYSLETEKIANKLKAILSAEELEVLKKDPEGITYYLLKIEK